MSEETLTLPSGREVKLRVPVGEDMITTFGDGGGEGVEGTLALITLCSEPQIDREEIGKLAAPDFMTLLRTMNRLAGIGDAGPTSAVGENGSSTSRSTD